MTEIGYRRHALEPFLARIAGQGRGEAGLVLEILPYGEYFNLRGDPHDAGFLDTVQKSMKQKLPVAANTFTEGGFRILWLGPDEWLIMTRFRVRNVSVAERREQPHPATTDPANRLGAEEFPQGMRMAASGLVDTLAGLPHALTDLRGGLICIRLSGTRVRDVLAKGSTLDFHDRVFRVGHCAQTVLGKASMLIARLGCNDNAPAVRDDSALVSAVPPSSADPAKPPQPVEPKGRGRQREKVAQMGSANASGSTVAGDDTTVFDIVVRRTFAEYAAEWLYRGAQEYGVQVQCRD